MGLTPIKTDLQLKAEDFDKKASEALPVFGRIKQDSEALAAKELADAKGDLADTQVMIRDTAASNQDANARGSQLLDDLDVSVTRQKKAQDMNPFMRKVRNFFGDDAADLKQINRNINFTQNRLVIFNQKENLRRNSLANSLNSFIRKNKAETDLFQTKRAALNTETQALAQSVGLMKQRFDVVASAARASNESLIRNSTARGRVLASMTLIDLQTAAASGQSSTQGGIQITTGDYQNEIIKKKKEQVALATAETTLMSGRVDLANAQYEQVTSRMGTAELIALAENGGTIPPETEGGVAHEIPMEIVQNALVNSMEKDNKIAGLQMDQNVDLNEVIRNTQLTSDLVEGVVTRMGMDVGFNRMDQVFKNEVSKSIVQLQGMLPRNTDGSVAVSQITGAKASKVNRLVDSITTKVATAVKRISDQKFPGDKAASVGYQAYLSNTDIDQRSASEILFKQLTGPTPSGLTNQPEYAAAHLAMTTTASKLMSEMLQAESPVLEGMSPTEIKEAMIRMVSQIAAKSGGKFGQTIEQRTMIQKVMEAGRKGFEGELHTRFQLNAPEIAANVSYQPSDPEVLGDLDNGVPRPHPFAQVPKQMMNAMMISATKATARIVEESRKNKDEIPLKDAAVYNQALLEQLQMYGGGVKFSAEFETAADAFLDLAGRDDVRSTIQAQVNNGRENSYTSYLTANGALGSDVIANWDWTLDNLRNDNVEVTSELIKDRNALMRAYGNDSGARNNAILSAVGEAVGMTEDQTAALFEATREALPPSKDPNIPSGRRPFPRYNPNDFTNVILSGKFDNPVTEALRKKAAKEWVVVSRAVDAAMARLSRASSNQLSRENQRPRQNQRPSTSFNRRNQ